MIWKITALLAIVLVLIGTVAYSKIKNIGIEGSEQVLSLIDENRMLELLRRFYSDSESEHTWLELKSERLSLAIMKGSVTSVKSGIFLHGGDSDWQVFVSDTLSFSFSKDGITIDADTNEKLPAILLRGGAPRGSLSEKIDRQSSDLLFIVHDGHLLFFDLDEKRYFYRQIN